MQDIKQPISLWQDFWPEASSISRRVHNHSGDAQSCHPLFWGRSGPPGFLYFQGGLCFTYVSPMFHLCFTYVLGGRSGDGRDHQGSSISRVV